MWNGWKKVIRGWELILSIMGCLNSKAVLFVCAAPPAAAPVAAAAATISDGWEEVTAPPPAGWQ